MTRGHKKAGVLMAALAGVLLLFAPDYAFAQPGLTISTCAPGVPSWQVTTTVVTCVENSVELAVVLFIGQLTQAIQMPVMVLFVMAIMFFGFRIILSGEREIRLGARPFIMRFTLVCCFAVSMNQFATLPFQIVNQGLALVTGGWSPWVQIDTMLGQMMGFGPGLALFQGLLGIIGASLFSAASGFYLFTFGIMAILSMLGFVFRGVYTFLIAVVLIGFLIAVSPMIVPMAVFGYGEQYFRRWLNILMAAILQQIMLFAFLWLFLGYIGSFISQVFTVLGGNNFAQFWRTSVPFFSWAMSSDPSLFEHMEGQGMQRGAPLVTSLMNPLLGRSMDLGAIMNHPGIDLGPNGIITVQQLIAAFLPMAITAHLLRTMMEHIPQLASSIVGAGSHIGFEQIPGSDIIKKALGSIGGGG